MSAVMNASLALFQGHVVHCVLVSHLDPLHLRHKLVSFTLESFNKNSFLFSVVEIGPYTVSDLVTLVFQVVYLLAVLAYSLLEVADNGDFLAQI